MVLENIVTFTLNVSMESPSSTLGTGWSSLPVVLVWFAWLLARHILVATWGIHPLEIHSFRSMLVVGVRSVKISLLVVVWSASFFGNPSVINLAIMDQISIHIPAKGTSFVLILILISFIMSDSFRVMSRIESSLLAVSNCPDGS